MGVPFHRGIPFYRVRCTLPGDLIPQGTNITRRFGTPRVSYYAIALRADIYQWKKRVQTSNENVFNKNRVIRTATKRTETCKCMTSNAMDLHP